MTFPLWLLLSACSTPDPEDPSQRRAVLVVLDGVRMEESLGVGTNPLTGEDISTFFPDFRQEILPTGTLITPAFSSDVTVTGPAHCTLFTGRRLPFGHYPVGPDIGDYVPEVPGLFQALVQARPKAKALYTSNTEFVHPMMDTLYPGFDLQGEWYKVMEDGDETKDDGLVLTETLAEMKKSHPQLVAINLHHADNAGHGAKKPEDYLSAAAKLDDPLVAFWNGIQEISYYQGATYLVVVADHGRHTDDYKEHGDACAGCRTVPLFWAGPDIPPNQTLSTPADLADIAPTLAQLMNLSLPHAEGHPIAGLTTAQPPAGIWMATKNAEIRLESDASARKSLWSGDTQLSSSGAYEVGGVIEVGDARCWREQLWEGAAPGGYVGRCQVAGGEIEVPWGEVSPNFVPGLAWDGKTLYAMFDDNPEGRVTLDPGPMPLRLARWTGTWEVADVDWGTYFPQSPVLTALGGDKLIAAYAGSDDGLTGRLHRRVHVQSIDWSGTSPVIGEPILFSEGGRQDRVAVWGQGSMVRIAFIEATTERVVVRLATSGDGGASFDDAPEVSGDGVMPHITPVFGEDGTLYWAEVGESGSELWQKPVGEGARCTGVSGEVGSLSAGVATVRRGEWEREEF